MIDYNYILKRDEQEQLRTFRPNKTFQSLPNLVYIEGPNSSGKSTLLHILASSFFGLKNKSLKQSLQEKLDNLINSEHQHISFKVKISDIKGKTRLLAEKKDLKGKEITLRDGNGELITFENFTKNYNLIYDIPEDPTKRLGELTHEIKDIQLWFDKKLGSLRSRLVRVITDIREAKDPRKIVKTKKEQDELKRQKAQASAHIEQWKEDLKSLRLYTSLRFYMENKLIRDKIKAPAQDYQRLEQRKKKDRAKASKRSVELRKLLTDEVDNIESIYYNVTPVITDLFGKKDKNRIKLWKDLNVNQEIANPNIKQVLKIEGSYFRNKLQELQDKDKDKEHIKEAHVFRELINLLEGYKSLKIKIPGTDITISRLIEALKKETKKYIDILSRGEAIKNAIDGLTEIIKKRKYIIDDLIPEVEGSIAESSEEKTVEDDTEYYRAKKMKARLEEIEGRIDYYKEECIKAGIPEKEILAMYQSIILGRALKKLEGYDEPGLKEKIYNLENDINTERKQLVKFGSDIDYLDREIERLEKKKLHQYHSQLEYLQQMLLYIQNMEQKINDYDEYIRQLIGKKIDISKNKRELEEKNKYFEHVFCYLGKRVNTIRHIDKEYKTTKIDLVKNEILTTSGTVIKIADMGTGQSQSAFLKGLLSANDGRIIIALFDEVAMMDKSSLAPIYNKLKELYKNERLLVGIIVQKGEGLKAVSIK